MTRWPTVGLPVGAASMADWRGELDDDLILPCVGIVLNLVRTAGPFLKSNAGCGTGPGYLVVIGVN